MTAIKARTQACNVAKARKRLADARAYLETAAVISSDDSGALGGVRAALAVLAGIAAADAATCATLRLRSRSENHKDAVAVVKRIVHPDANAAANALARLIDIKDAAHYGFDTLNAQKRAAAVRHAERMLALAEDILSA